MKHGDKTVRWGILGTARIATRNWKAIHASGAGLVGAVASRQEERCRAFVSDLQESYPFSPPPEILGSYEELIENQNIDAIYVPLPTALRKSWVIRAAEAGKHVLCEKPGAVDAEELREMIDVCRRHKVLFMDGVMFMHNPRLSRLREILDEPEAMGRIRRIQSAFTFSGTEGFHNEDIRVDSRLEPLGCLGDLGWYCIRYALWVMNWEVPGHVTGRILSEALGIDDETGSPTEFSGELFFGNGISCGFYCSFLAQHQQWASVSGSKGVLRVFDFVNPSPTTGIAFELNEQTTLKSSFEGDLSGEVTEDSQEARMFRRFRDEITNGRPDDRWAAMTLQTQEIMDACYASARAGSVAVSMQD